MNPIVRSFLSARDNIMGGNTGAKSLFEYQCAELNYREYLRSQERIKLLAESTETSSSSLANLAARSPENFTE